MVKKDGMILENTSLTIRKDGQVFEKTIMMLEINDLAFAYLEGYIHAKVTEHLLQGKVLSSDFDKVKKDSCGMYERLYFSIESH